MPRSAASCARPAFRCGGQLFRAWGAVLRCRQSRSRSDRGRGTERICQAGLGGSDGHRGHCRRPRRYRELFFQRIQGITEGLRKRLPDVALTQLDTSGNAVKLEVPLGKFLASQTRRKVLVATLDDPTALAAEAAIERASRMSDCVIIGQGVDKSIHGGANDKKEIDPNNRGSIILGSVAYYIDRYGYDVLPLAMTMLQGREVPKRTITQHMLVTAKNVFTEYPPYDMN